MAKRKDQSKHDKMIKAIAEYLKRNNHENIKADISEYNQPATITWKNSGKGHIPDLTSQKNRVSYIFEIETSDSIDDSHTEDQWRLFSLNAEQHSKKFIVVVPKNSEQSAWNRAKKLKINVDDVFTVS